MIDPIQISDAANIIKNSKYIVVFTGAGISTESGIADFRSEGGLWSRYNPDIYASYFYFLEDPSKFWEMHNELEDIMAEAEPNPAHLAIAELEKMGKVKAIITQNVDMLHQKAGSGSYNDIPIYELHGSYGIYECINCKKTWDHSEIETKNVSYPACEECKGFIKPKVILFGEALPMGIMDQAMNECQKCDCFLMVGSSLVVSPANFMPRVAKEHGAQLIFINRDHTFMDELADIFLLGSASEILTEIMRKLR
ncbi:MAG: NAD-dependent deacylase [Promethearchaeota archaeon]|nr:MAG: NAD-dependent deacylase [Candidatus Lokiarchaeota archaeon]